MLFSGISRERWLHDFSLISFIILFQVDDWYNDILELDLKSTQTLLGLNQFYDILDLDWTLGLTYWTQIDFIIIK